jgi:hypothetical protein
MTQRRAYKPRPNMPIGSGIKRNAVYAGLYSGRSRRKNSALLPETGQQSGNVRGGFPVSEVSRGADAEVLQIRPSAG